MTARGNPPPLAMVAVLALAFTALGYLIGSQSNPPPAEPQPWLASLAADLDLRADQIAAIDRLLAEEDADLAALVSRQRAELREPVAARRERTEQAMLALLDDNQRETYDQLTRP